MDFDEYEYLEKTMEYADLVKGSNGSGVKSRSAEKRRTGEDGEDVEDGYRSKRHRSGDGEREKSERSLNDRDQGNREISKDRGDRGCDRLERLSRDRGYRDRERDHRDEGRRHSKDRDRDRVYERDSIFRIHVRAC